MGSLESAYLQAADRLNGMDHRLNRVDQGMALLRSEAIQNFRWIMSAVLVSWSATFLAIIFRH